MKQTQVISRPYRSSSRSSAPGVSASSLVPLQMGTVAPGASVRAARQVQRERHLVGNFLKDDIVSGVFQHDVGVVSVTAAGAVSVSAAHGCKACGGLFLTRLREVAHALQVADHARQIVRVAAVADGAFFQVALVDVAAVVADGVRDVEREIVRPLAAATRSSWRYCAFDRCSSRFMCRAEPPVRCST